MTGATMTTGAVGQRSPTLAELRARVHKARHREVGNWLARRVARPTAVYGTWLAIRLGLSAHHVTAAAWLTWMASAIAIGWGTRAMFVVGVALAHLAFWLDHVDGQVARWRGTVSLDGVYLDYLMHHAANLATGFALGYGLAARSGDPRWTIAGIAIAGGWAMLGLHNDCRYKAFFQRLKAATASYRVDGGSGGRPQPPAPWPCRGRAALTWPAYKACESHVVLLGMTAMAFMAIGAPSVWLNLWRGGAVAMAVLAPLLAIGRIARAVGCGAAEDEFARWFRPIDPTSGRRSNPTVAAATPGHHSDPVVSRTWGGASDTQASQDSRLKSFSPSHGDADHQT
jgi:phosphatidylglycerophosphate synthase